MVGWNILVFSERGQDSSWCNCRVMQELHPYKDEKLLFKDELGTRDYTDTELKADVDNGLYHADIQAIKANVLLTAVASKTVDKGLQYFGHTSQPLIDDSNLVVGVKSSFDGSISVSPTKEDMKTLGEALYPTFNTNLDPQVFGVMPDDIFAINSANNLMDVLSYELQGINPYNGDVKIFDLVTLKELGISRSEIAINQAQKASVLNPSFSVDAQNIINVANYVIANINDCANLMDAQIMGVYIDSNVDKLPCGVLAWSL